MSDATGRTGPTSAQLKADIDSGRTGDKITHPDPGLSPLGTDDEAAGLTPSAERVSLARATESKPDGVHAQEVGRDSAKPRGFSIATLIAVIVVFAAVIIWRVLVSR